MTKMKTPLFKKALWIAEQMGRDTDPDDVYDVLLGNITKPSYFKATVDSYLDDYDNDFEKHS